MQRWSVYIVPLLMLVSAGCSLFEPRDAEPPGSGGTPWQVPTVPTAVFRNMESGLEDLTGVNYERSLNDAFTYVPDGGTASQFPPGRFENWSRQDEITVIQRIVGDNSDVSVTFTNTPITDTGSFAQFEGTYALVLTSTATGDVTEYRARARYDLVRSGSGWQLVKWEDLDPESGFATWGFLRGTFRTGGTP